MLISSLAFLIIALPVALFGLGDGAGMTTWLAEVLFAISFLMFLSSLVFHHWRRGAGMAEEGFGQ